MTGTNLYPIGNAVKSYDLNDREDLNKLMTIEEQKTIECLIGSSEDRQNLLNFKKNEIFNDDEKLSQQLIEKNSKLIKNINSQITPTLRDLESTNKNMFYTYDSNAAKTRISRSGPVTKSALKNNTSPTNFIYNNQINNIQTDNEFREQSEDVLQYTDSRSDRYDLVNRVTNFNKNLESQAINIDQNFIQNNLGFALKPNNSLNKPEKEITLLQRNSASIKSQENMMILRGKAKSDQIKKTRYQDLLAQHYHKNKQNSHGGNISRNKPNLGGSNKYKKNDISNNSQREQ